MAQPIKLFPQLTRVVSHFKKFDIEVPKALLEAKAKKPDLTDFPYPLPQKKKDYTCFCEGANGVMWYGSNGGVTRYDPNAKSIYDIVMYFGASRDLLDNNVQALFADGDGVWVLTANGVTHIEMVKMSMEEKAYRLLDETLTYVQRHGMVSQKRLAEAGNLKSALPYGHSDNDGSFSSAYAMGEIFHYATLKKEKGAYDEETLRAREVAMRASEANLLLMYIAGRGNGFVARTYLTKDEPVPDDGLFYKKNGATASCLNTTDARHKKVVGLEVKADAPIPERLRKMYTEEGYEDTDITYKGDTSSDEITHHYMHLLVAHEFLGCEDPEYDELLKTAARNTMNHIIDNGFQLREADGNPTTWAKWNEDYFNSAMGWADACLNAAELLMFLRVTMHITGEAGKWQETYDMLCERGYDKLTMGHFDRFHKVCLQGGIDDREDIMYGDHNLAVLSLWGLVTLEPDEERREMFIKAFRSWRYSLAPEYTPAYDFPYFLSDPEAQPDEERVKTWFYRFNVSRLASAVSLTSRRDYPVKLFMGDYREVSALPPNDERFIAKLDRDPLEYKNEDSGGVFCVESCYVYTFSYWLGRYFGFIEEGEE
ncbi:MAG: hypothetical protein E7533_05730 [Ruminococcaceae bacterium]|nr:hypothetical protein [Oscillospiraceae bacterium]